MDSLISLTVLQMKKGYSKCFQTHDKSDKP